MPWMRLTTAILMLALTACQTTTLAQKWQLPSEDVSFQGHEKRYGSRIIPAELHFPQQTKGKLPLIISQHGSSRDGGSIIGGKGRTDEFSARLIKHGTNAGFAVAVLDAFEGTGVQPSDKKQFPRAALYAAQLRGNLATHPRIDAQNLFYTGFSFGGSAVLNFLDAQIVQTQPLWRAIAAAEPGCNTISEAIKAPFATIIIKGDESHYPPAPCALYRDLLVAKGSDVDLLVIPKANHFFSKNGRIVDGVAVNGCSDNPVIRLKNGRLQFFDGAPTTKAEVIKRCITNRAGAGKSREYLDYAIDQIITFFKAQQIKN
jgi:dienelactone hydrolase